MIDVLRTIVWCFLRRLVLGQATEVDVAALGHQVLALRRLVPGRPKFTSWDRLFFAEIYRANPRSLENLLFVKLETVVRWHCAGFLTLAVIDLPFRSTLGSGTFLSLEFQRIGDQNLRVETPRKSRKTCISSASLLAKFGQ